MAFIRGPYAYWVAVALTVVFGKVVKIIFGDTITARQ